MCVLVYYGSGACAIECSSRRLQRLSNADVLYADVLLGHA